MKAQVSAEFMAVVIIVLVFSLAFYAMAFGKETTAQREERQGKLNSICNNLATRITNAEYYGFGFIQNYTLPEDLDGLDYNISVGNNTIVCNTSTYVSIQNFVARNVTNSTNYPPFSIPIKEIKIENILGIVVIT
jgi:hypothetical protein